MRYSRLFLAAAVFMWAAAVSARETAPTVVELSTRLEPAEVPLNREAVLTIEVTWSGDIDQIEIESLDEPVLTNFEIRATATANRVEDVAGERRAVKRITYRLQPVTLGMAYVESVSLAYRDIAAGTVQHLLTRRVGVKAVAPVPEREGTAAVWLWLAVPAVLLAAAAWLFLKAGKRRKESDVQQEAPILEERFLRELKNGIDPETSQRSDAFTYLSKLFRRYLAEKFSIAALEVTSADLITLMIDEGLDEELIEETSAMMQKADLVKFSAQDAEPAELRDAYTTVETFLEEELAREREERLTDAGGASGGMRFPGKGRLGRKKRKNSAE
ncbi:hypothetical protein JXO52_04135 [bacterium]|nr:hypothetical protein [bacterium]